MVMYDNPYNFTNITNLPPQTTCVYVCNLEPMIICTIIQTFILVLMCVMFMYLVARGHVRIK